MDLSLFNADLQFFVLLFQELFWWAIPNWSSYYTWGTASIKGGYVYSLPSNIISWNNAYFIIDTERIPSRNGISMQVQMAVQPPLIV